MVSQVYNELNKAWKSTCKILFGEEISDLKDYEEWLVGYWPLIGKRKSHVSGKEVALSMGDYCKTARFVSLDEVKQKSIDPLTINEVKDIDSIVEAISEKWEYTGNIILGNSKFVEGSSSIINSQYVYNSYEVSDSSYIAYSAYLRKDSRYIFGALGLLSEFVIKGFIMNVKRGFEANYTANSSDIYFTFNCNNCNDLMFCFNLKNKKHCIGNLQLSLDKYKELKRKLVVEMREELKRNKELPSIFDLCKNTEPQNIKISIAKKTEPEFDIKPIEKAFSSTCRVIFSKDIGSIAQYEKYLSKHFKLAEENISPFGSKVYTVVGKPYPDLPKNRTVSEEESYELANIPLNENEIRNFEALKENVDKISYFVGQFKEGNFSNYDKAYFVINSSNIYKVNDSTNSEYCGVDHIALNSKYAFGCWRILESQFAINCHNSIRLSRCFEADCSSDCSDSYFIHNCENVINSMFCFNAKNLRNAIGNAPLPSDKYRKVKDSVIQQVADELESKKDFKWDIYNIGCGKI